MPFLDNFAHCGGMLMGLFMGLGLLVQKREDDHGDRLNKKCYQASAWLLIDKSWREWRGCRFY